MKRFMTYGSLALALVLGLLLAPPAARAGDDELQLGLDGLDPVALIGGEEKPGDPKITAAYGLYEYRFASEENKETFESDPESYGIQGDGMCPVVPTAPVDPGIFTVYEDKIYAFASPGCIDAFYKDPERYVDAT